jgi:nucleoside-diphosphate-sugar epimerase
VTISSLEFGQPGEAYNIAGSAENSINEALDIISLHLDKKLNITRKPGARGDQKRTFGDTSKAMSVLNLRSTVSLSEGLRREIDWLKNQHIA